MISVEHKVGDLLNSTEVVIAHGCNTVGVMGAGIALAVKRRWPEVYSEYEAACGEGTFTAGSAQNCRTNDFRTVFNLGTQRDPGAGARYWWVLLSFGNMFEQMIQLNLDQVAIPRIGCGIGGLEWSGVEQAIMAAQDNEPDSPRVVVFTHPSDENKTWR